MALSQAHRTHWGRIVLGLFILAWGSASAQPCLMAMNSPDQPQSVAMHGMHGEHGSGHDEMPDCEHCPPAATSAAALCAQGVNADCGSVPDSNSDGRSQYQKLKFDIQPAMPSGLHEEEYKPALRSFAYPGDKRQLKHRCGPALNVKHCVFLK